MRSRRLPPPPGSMRWLIQGNTGVTPWEFGLWMLSHPSRDPDPTEFHAVHEDLLLNMNGVINDLLSHDAGSNVSRLYNYGLGANVSERLSYAGNGLLGTALPACCATEISLHVQGRGKGSNGRVFFPGPRREDVELDSIFAIGAYTRINNAFDTFVHGISEVAFDWGGPIELGVLHRRADGVDLDPVQLRPIEGFHVMSRVATQVKRLRRATAL